MRRIITTSIASSLLALALPAAASAHGSARHHHHHRRAHTVVFTHGATKTVPGVSAPVTPAPTPTESQPAGMISSFEGGVLKIALTDGSIVTGKVTEATRIECGANGAEDNGDGNDQGHGDFVHGDDEHGGNQDQGNQDQGDDDGQQAEGETAEETCGQAALKPGAKVTEAELAVTSAGSIWRNVELAQ
jgi:hypothetical protein